MSTTCKGILDNYNALFSDIPKVSVFSCDDDGYELNIIVEKRVCLSERRIKKCLGKSQQFLNEFEFS